MLVWRALNDKEKLEESLMKSLLNEGSALTDPQDQLDAANARVHEVRQQESAMLTKQKPKTKKPKPPSSQNTPSKLPKSEL